jgi:hypothetical protein
MWEICCITGGPFISLETLCPVGLVIMMEVSVTQESSACDGAAEVSGLTVLVETEELIDIRLDVRATLHVGKLPVPPDT